MVKTLKGVILIIWPLSLRSVNTTTYRPGKTSKCSDQIYQKITLISIKISDNTIKHKKHDSESSENPEVNILYIRATLSAKEEIDAFDG